MTKPFHIYRSSAGSGKTRTLAKEYIKLALGGKPDYYRFILAVTFANQATLEMKERIMHYLDDFAKGKANDLGHEIKNELSLTDAQLQAKSKEVQSAILHHYSQFAISTIDAFFQKVIRSFTREAGLLGNFRLEVDHDLVLDEVIAELMDELGSNEQLTQWVVEFSRDRLLEGENWNITEALKGFSREIFNENFKVIEDDILKPFEKKKNPYHEYLGVLRKEVSVFQHTMKGLAKKALEILDKNGITVDDFNGKDRGTAFKYFTKFSLSEYVEITATVSASLESAEKWPVKKSLKYRAFLQLAENELMPLLREMVSYDDKNFKKFNSARLVLKNFYSFGLLADITRKLKDYKEENNLMLLSDAPKFLNGVINDSDTPFIYEKVGSFFKNYLIDEFQDTSGYQWKNFLPLLKDSLDQNQSNLIVGDVKQSIYRWRGGDLQLLQSEVEAEIGKSRTEVTPLDTNYRSADNIVTFNNKLFQRASAIVSDVLTQPLPEQAFFDVHQKPFKFPGKGYVRINFMERGEDEESWDEQAMKQLPQLLEELQDKKVALNDVAIIVRKNAEGQRIATYLLQYKNSGEAKPDYKYDVVSRESLRLDTAASVNLLLSALKYLDNPNDAVVRGQLAFEVMKGQQLENIFYDAGKNNLQAILPEEFIRYNTWLNKLSIFELTEELIRIFKLGEEPKELAYLQAFQDLVLEFAALEKNDVASFLLWWDNNKSKKSIQVAGNVNAVNILTIHRSKGLQFKYVIIPFCHWKLNHEQPPLLWTASSEKPFDTLGHLAVRYSSSLDRSLFQEDYQQELVKAHLDNLNLLYVALTRAEEGLIIAASKPNQRNLDRARNEKRLGTVGDLLYECICQDELYNPMTNQYELGKLEKLNTAQNRDQFTPTSLAEYASYDWRKKLVIKKQGAEFFLPEVSDKRVKINYGITLHTALSRIHYASQVSSVLHELYTNNGLSKEEMEVISTILGNMMKHPVIGKWFGKEWTVKTEATVLMPGARQSRIDRVMMSPKRTVIVDYKTGEKKEIDRKQVEDYAGLLSRMGYTNVEAYLLYLDELEVVEVMNKSNLSLF